MSRKIEWLRYCHTWKVIEKLKVRGCVKINMRNAVMEGLNAKRFEDAILQF